MNAEGRPIPIERGGGKLEATRALAGLGFPVPASRYLYYDDLNNATLIAASLRDLKPPYIVRGSHQNDWHGYIDVLPTFPGLTTQEEVQRAIEKIQQAAAGEDLRVHAQDWGQPFSPEVHVLLQELSPSQVVGSVLRHPHKLGAIDINYVNIEDRNGYYDIFGNFQHAGFSGAHRYESGDFFNNTIQTKVPDDELREVISVYEAVESSGLLDPEYVYQMEIGLDPFAIYQVRPFRRKEPAQDYNIPYTYNATFPSISSDLVFGITPEEGIELPFVVANPYDIEEGILEDRVRSGEPFGLILVTYDLGSLPPNVRLGNLTMTAVASVSFNYLQHGEYRYLKRAPFASVQNTPHGVNQSSLYHYQPGDFSEFERSRYWSNGKRGLIVPTHHVEKLHDLHIED